MEDALVLREELAQLKKDIISSRKVKDDLDSYVKTLYEEELRYISEISAYKKQSEENKFKAEEASKQCAIVNDKLSKFSMELQQVKELINKENLSLNELKETQQKIIKETSEINLHIQSRHAELKDKEKIYEYQINKINSLDLINKTKEAELIKREVEINNKEVALEHGHKNLESAIEIHSNNVSIHSQNVRSLSEMRKFHEEDENSLRDKLNNADRLVKEQIDIKVSLSLQEENLKKEIDTYKRKQDSLDKHIADLKNQENLLKIKELKILKIAREAGVEKELKELEESLK